MKLERVFPIIGGVINMPFREILSTILVGWINVVLSVFKI